METFPWHVYGFMADQPAYVDMYDYINSIDVQFHKWAHFQ